MGYSTKMERPESLYTLPNKRTAKADKLAVFNRGNYTVNGKVQDAMEVAESYIGRHTTVQVCDLHIDPNKISPFWAKVSTTPFDAPAKMRQGYGRQLKKSYISVDAPRDSFIDPEKVPVPANRMSDRVACVTRVPLHQDPLLPTQVLPGGLSLAQVKQTTTLTHTRFRTYPHDKQTLMGACECSLHFYFLAVPFTRLSRRTHLFMPNKITEPLVTERSELRAIEWGPIKPPIVLADPLTMHVKKRKGAK